MIFSVRNPNRSFGFRHYFLFEPNLVPNREALSEIQSRSDFSIPLYCTVDVRKPIIQKPDLSQNYKNIIVSSCNERLFGYIWLCREIIIGGKNIRELINIILFLEQCFTILCKAFLGSFPTLPGNTHTGDELCDLDDFFLVNSSRPQIYI